jgi:hypothetical protein
MASAQLTRRVVGAFFDLGGGGNSSGVAIELEAEIVPLHLLLDERAKA